MSNNIEALNTQNKLAVDGALEKLESGNADFISNDEAKALMAKRKGEVREKAMTKSLEAPRKFQTYKQRHGHDINGVRPVMIPDDAGEWVNRFDAEHLAEQLKRAQLRIAELEALCVKSDAMREVVPLCVKLPDSSSKAFWSGTGKTEQFHPETYKRWVKEAIERAGDIAGIQVEVK